MAIDIDLNSDLGEGAPSDAAVIPLITSANVACCFHAGDPTTARTTMRLAVEKGVVIGAHPGHPDRDHFGRRMSDRSPEKVFDDCVFQIGAMMGLARIENAQIKYVKPHGGLYHQACDDEAYAESVIAAANLFGLMVVGLPGSQLEIRSKGRCTFVAEGFADRRYRADGRLVPRDQPGALIDDPAEAVAQVDRLIRELGIRTICVHGDNPQAILFVTTLRESLQSKGIAIRPFA